MSVGRLNREVQGNQFTNQNEIRNNERAGENQVNSAVNSNQTDTARQRAASNRERNANLNPNEALSAKRLAEQNKGQNVELTAEQKKRREIERRFPFRTLTEVPGEMTRADVARAKGILTGNLDVPPGATAEEVQQLQIAAAKKDSRMEMTRTGQTTHLQEFEAGGRTARIKSEVRFQQESTVLKNAPPAFAEGLTPQQIKQLNIRTNNQLAREVREMKQELAETGASRIQRDFLAANGKTYRLEVRAEWRQTTEFRVVDSDARTHRYEWVEAQKPETNRMSNDEGGRIRFRSRHDDDSDAPRKTSTRFQDLGNGRIITLRSRHDDGGEFEGTGPTREFTERIEKIHASRAAAEKQLNHQLEIENFVREVRSEMVANNQSSFSDRKIIGQKYAYEVDASVTFDQRSQLLNPKEPNAVEKYIAENPNLTPAEIKNLNADFSQLRRSTIEQTITSLKQQLAQTGEKVASTVVDISGEKHRITVRADWRVKAEHHSIDEADVERLMRDTLVFNGGDDFKTMYKFGGRRFEGEAAVDFDLKLERLNSNQPSQLDLLRQSKHLLSPEEFAKAKRQLGEVKQLQLGATVLDMQRDMARAGDERMTRVVTVNGEKYRVTASADWDVEADRKRSSPLGTILKIVAGVAGVATGQMWIPAAVNFIDSAARGNGLGMLTSGLSFVGGVTSGVVSQIANTSSQVISAGSVIANPNAGLFDKILAGVDIGANVAKFTNPGLANRLNDISDWGSKANMLIKGDAAGLFQSVATEYIGKALRNELQRVDRDTSSPKPLSTAAQAEIATGKNAAVVQKAVNRVRQVYDQIYDRMDERGRTAANTIIQNARRRGVDPNLAMAQVGNLVRETKDLDALIRADAARRGIPETSIRRSLDRLLNENTAQTQIIVNQKALDPDKGKIVTAPVDKTSGKDLSGVPTSDKEIKAGLRPVSMVEVPSNPTEADIRAAVNRTLEALGLTPINPNQPIPANSQIVSATVARDGNGNPRLFIGEDGKTYVDVILTLHGGQNVSATDYMRQQFSEIEGLISQNHSYPLSDQPAALAQLESYRPYIGSERIDALREAIVTRPVQTRLTGYGFLNPNQIDGINGSVTTGAVRNYQGFNGLQPNGRLDQNTLRSLHSNGHRTQSDAIRLQTRLQELGYYNGEIDGIWGTQTEQAVRAFQNNNSWEGQSLNVTGVIDDRTASSILQRSAVPSRPNQSAPPPASNIPYTRLNLDVPPIQIRQNQPTARENYFGSLLQNVGENLQGTVVGLTQLPQIAWDMTLGGIFDPRGAQSRLDAALLEGEVRTNQLVRDVGLPRAMADYFLIDPLQQPGETDAEYHARLISGAITEFGPDFVVDNLNRGRARVNNTTSSTQGGVAPNSTNAPNSNLTFGNVTVVPEGTPGTPNQADIREVPQTNEVQNTLSGTVPGQQPMLPPWGGTSGSNLGATPGITIGRLDENGNFVEAPVNSLSIPVGSDAFPLRTWDTREPFGMSQQLETLIEWGEIGANNDISLWRFPDKDNVENLALDTRFWFGNVNYAFLTRNLAANRVIELGSDPTQLTSLFQEVSPTAPPERFSPSISILTRELGLAHQYGYTAQQTNGGKWYLMPPGQTHPDAVRVQRGLYSADTVELRQGESAADALRRAGGGNATYEIP
jgi:peptidoglycan hydrolase-like protein with peptidoglycan-binding domain